MKRAKCEKRGRHSWRLVKSNDNHDVYVCTSCETVMEKLKE